MLHMSTHAGQKKVFLTALMIGKIDKEKLVKKKHS